jgi:TonB family protein
VEKRDQRKSAAWALLVFSSLLGACVFLTAFTIQTPPPGDQFVAVGLADWGEAVTASGAHESETPSEKVEEAVAASEASESTQESSTPPPVVTQSASELSIPVTPEPVVVPVKIEPEPEPDPVVSQALSNLLGTMATSGGGGSQGSSDATAPGNEGDTDGQIDGMGVVSGDFGEAQLEGGTLVGRPSLDEKPTEEGYVRIRITVNKAGNVTSTRYDPVNSSMRDSEHIALAIRAAKTATFTPNASQPIRSGYITIRFELE